MAHNNSDDVDHYVVTIHKDAGSLDAIDYHIVNYCMVFVSSFAVDMVRNSNSVLDMQHRPTYNHSLTYSLCMDISTVNSTV